MIVSELRRRKVHWMMAGAALLAVIIGLVQGGPRQDRPAPALPTQVLHGPPVTVAQLRGHPAVVAFWGSYCDPCVAEAPALEHFAQSGGRIVGVDNVDPSSGARAFLAKHAWTFPVLADPDGTVGHNWRITNLPTVFVLDSSGRIVQTLHGPQTAAGLQRAVSAA